MATLNISDYRQAGDPDDTRSIERAIDAANPGDVVQLPPETVDVFAFSGPAVGYIDDTANGVTLQGHGEQSRIRMRGGVSSSDNSWVIGIRTDKGPVNFTLRHFVVDGNLSNNQPRGGGRIGDSNPKGINIYPGGNDAGNSITIEHVRVTNSGSGILTSANATLRNVTVAHTDGHGLGFGSWGNGTQLVEDSLFIDNDGLGIDHNDGNATMRRCWMENNRQGGAKNPWPVTESWWRDCVFANNPGIGYRYNGDRDGGGFDVHMDNCLAFGNDREGYWFGGDVYYDLGVIEARDNNSSDGGPGNIYVVHNARIQAESVLSHDAARGSGLYYSSDRHSDMTVYTAGNPGGGVVGDQLGNATITERTFTDSMSINPLDKRTVGAWPEGIPDDPPPPPPDDGDDGNDVPPPSDPPEDTGLQTFASTFVVGLLLQKILGD